MSDRPDRVRWFVYWLAGDGTRDLDSDSGFESFGSEALARTFIDDMRHRRERKPGDYTFILIEGKVLT